MKIGYYFFIIGIITATVIIGIFMTGVNQKSSTVSIETNQTNSTSPNVSIITIPKGSDEQSSGINYEPRYLTVVIGVNNTVRWINEADAGNEIVADTYNTPDPLFEKGPYSHGVILPGKSFNFTFTKPGEFQYDTEPHPWLYGWVVVLPQSLENATQTVIVNDKKIPGPCEIFRLPCPFNADRNFTALKFGNDIYIEKVTANGVDNYAIVKPDGFCYYPTSYDNSCRNPDDLAILRLVGVDTSIPQEDVNISITGLDPSYLVGDPINFGITVKGYGHCDVPSVLVTREGYLGWQSKIPWTSCQSGMGPIDLRYDIKDMGGPFYLNQSGTYTIHVGYASNMTEEQFNVTSQQGSNTIPVMYQNVTYTGHSIGYNITGDNYVRSATLDNSSDAIILSTYTTEDGNLTVTLMPDLVKLVKKENQETPFITLTDGEEVKYKEQLYNQNIILTIPFHSGTEEIEIIATEML